MRLMQPAKSGEKDYGRVAFWKSCEQAVGTQSTDSGSTAQGTLLSEQPG